MPRIVPLQLLKCLRVLLDNNGGILSTVEVRRIAGLMTKYSKKLVSKCVYVQILKSTKTELLGDFMSVGGWGLVCTWLNDAIRTMNWPLVQEILELLLLSPVDVNRLKINSAPILVKGLCKEGGNEGVRILAKRLVEQWLKIVTENSLGPCPLANPPSAGSVEPSLGATVATKESSGQGPIESLSSMEHSSSDSSTDSGGGGVVTQNYTITSAERKRNIVITIKSVDKSASAAASAAADSLYNHDDSSLPPSGSESGADPRGGAEDNMSVESCEKSILDDSSTTTATDTKSGDNDANSKKHKSARDKSKRSDRSDKDRKSSSSHRSSSSSHKSSSSSSSSSKSSSSKSSSSHRSSSDKYRDKDKARSSSSSSSKDKDRSSSSSSSSSSAKHKSSSKSSSSSSSSSSTPSSSKDRSRDKDKSSPSVGPKKENEKDNKLMPPPTSSSAQSDKKKEGEGGEVQKPKSIPILSRKASISIEIRRDTEKTATVKTYQSKFRSHGLTEEAPPPPSRKGLKKPTSAAAAAPPAIPSAPTLKRSSPPPTRGEGSQAEKKAKIDINNVSGHVERPGAAKLIAPKKIQTLVETNLFSDALAASIEPKKPMKRKKLNAATSPTEKDAPLAPLKFYQDTLDESKGEDKSDDSTKENDESRAGSPGKYTDADDDDIPLRKVKEDIEQKVQKEKAPADDETMIVDDIDDTPEEPKKPGPGCGPNGPPGILMLHRRKGPKKKLTWQPEEKLTQVRCFEVDRSERVNVTKQSFLEMKNMERYSERDALNIARRGFDDIMEPQMEWRPLIEVDNVPDHPNGNLSKQRIVQAEREATTLRALYFSPDMIPDSAAEAELEPHFSHDIPIIPIDDLTGNPDAVNDYSTSAWPEPKGYGTASNSSVEMSFNDSMSNMMPGLNPNLMPQGNPFQPFGNNFMPNTGNMPPNPNQQMPMNMQQPGPLPIWQNQMTGSPMMNNMNGPGPGVGGPGMDMNMPPNFMGNQFGSPVGPFGAPPQGFNNMNFPPMMMNGPGPGHGPMPGPMMNGPMPNGMGGPGPMPNGGGPRNNNRKAGGNWRSGGNNFQDNSGGNWRSAGSGSNRGGGVGGGGNTGICKQFMRGHCHMGKACKYVHPQKKRM